MSFVKVFYIAVMFVMCKLLYEADAQQCNPSEKSILGMMLQRHIFKSITGVHLGHACLIECYADVRCQSFNYLISEHVCELNNRTKEARPNDFVPNSERYYFRRDENRGD